jgi:hypothetical protein
MKAAMAIDLRQGSTPRNFFVDILFATLINIKVLFAIKNYFKVLFSIPKRPNGSICTSKIPDRVLFATSEHLIT